jgi:hypothetical protein
MCRQENLLCREKVMNVGLPTFEVQNNGHFKGPRPDLGAGKGHTSSVVGQS